MASTRAAPGIPMGVRSVPLSAWLGLVLLFGAFTQAAFVLCRWTGAPKHHVQHSISNDPHHHGLVVQFNDEGDVMDVLDAGDIGLVDVEPEAAASKKLLLDGLGHVRTNADLAALLDKVDASQRNGYIAAPDPAEASSSESGERGDGALPPIVVAHCEGRNVGHIPDQEHYGRLLIGAAFPERTVVYNKLDEWCNRTAETAYEHTDIIITVGLGFDQRYKDAVLHPPDGMSIEPPPDLVTNGLLTFRNPKIVRHAKDRTFMIAENGEASGGAAGWFDLLIETKADPKQSHRETTNLFWPLASRWLWQQRWKGRTVDDLILRPDFDPAAALQRKRRFCVFRHKQCDKGFYSTAAATRVALFDTLRSEYRPADSLGDCRRNGTAKKLFNVEPPEPDKNHFTTSSVDTSKPYKFVFAMENDFVEGYWTEKLVNPIFAESIPITAGFKPAGESLLAKYVNMDRIIYCQFDPACYADRQFPRFNATLPERRIEHIKTAQAKELSACVEQIKKVDTDDALYQSIISRPFLKGNTIAADSIFNLSHIASHVREAFRQHESYLLRTG